MKRVNDTYYAYYATSKCVYHTIFFTRAVEVKTFLNLTYRILYLNEKSLIQCIDLETAESFDKVYVSEQDITFLEIGSLDNKLLRYANLRIEKLS